MHNRNAFVTLTYKEKELVYGSNRATLYPRHLTLFFKRLRKKFGNGIRYFACGEYGEQYGRPHYHACIFGLDWEDKKYHSTKNGNRLYTSRVLDDLWSHGDCLSGDVTFESASYVARYICDKKIGEEASFYEKEGIEPEFVRMSRRPGLGLPWLLKYSGDVYNTGTMIARGRRMGIPRYYKEKFKQNEPEEMEKRAKIKMDELFDKKDFWDKKRLEIAEIVKKAQIRSLQRQKKNV